MERKPKWHKEASIPNEVKSMKECDRKLEAEDTKRKKEKAALFAATSKNKEECAVRTKEVTARSLLQCNTTKDATLLSLDGVAIFIHKSVAAQKSTVLKETFYVKDRVRGSSDIYQPISTIRVKGKRAAVDFIKNYLYLGLRDIELDTDGWMRKTMLAFGGSTKESLKRWVDYVCQIARVSKDLNLQPVMKMLIFLMYKSVMMKTHLTSMLLEELVTCGKGEEERVEEFVMLACHSYWFIKSKGKNDSAFVHGTDDCIQADCSLVEQLDESLFGGKPTINHRNVHSVMLVGSDLEEVNGVYTRIISTGLESQFEKIASGNGRCIYTENWWGFPGCSDHRGCSLKLLLEKGTKKRKAAEAAEDENVSLNSPSVEGKWTKGAHCVEWRTFDAFEGPVPLRFCLRLCEY